LIVCFKVPKNKNQAAKIYAKGKKGGLKDTPLKILKRILQFR